MPTKHKFEAGQTVGSFQIISQAESHGGHARWNVECRTCGAPSTSRATDIRAHRLRCFCQRGESPITATVVPLDGPTNDDVLRALREISGDVIQLSGTLHTVLDEVRSLRNEVKQLRGAQIAATLSPATAENPAIAHAKPEAPKLEKENMLDKCRREKGEVSAKFGPGEDGLAAALEHAKKLSTKGANYRTPEEADEMGLIIRVVADVNSTTLNAELRKHRDTLLRLIAGCAKQPEPFDPDEN